VARKLTQLEANLVALEVTLTPDQLAELDATTTPALPFPTHNNRELGPMIAYVETTINGHNHPIFPTLRESTAR
jgi:hypothetical protein